MPETQMKLKQNGLHNLHIGKLHLWQIPFLWRFPSSKSTCLRGRQLVFPSPIVADQVNPRRTFTRESTKKKFPVKDDAVETSAQRKLR
jgi:hypothetical protein